MIAKKSCNEKAKIVKICDAIAVKTKSMVQHKMDT